MKAGDIYRITEDINNTSYPTIKVGDLCLILTNRSTIVKTLINERIYSWLIWDLELAIKPI
jgi:hypothetical protein